MSASVIEDAAETTRRGLAAASELVVIVAARRRADRERDARERPGAAGLTPPRSTITDVALTAAVAGTPGASPSSSTASRVTAA